MLSRVADSLYWLGRYLERAEFAARLAEINLHLALDHSHDEHTERWSRMLAAADCSADTAEDNGYPAIDALAGHFRQPLGFLFVGTGQFDRLRKEISR
ncbi:MAG: alpha-E domain-containing protein [Myxococcota bacterium]